MFIYLRVGLNVLQNMETNKNHKEIQYYLKKRVNQVIEKCSRKVVLQGCTYYNNR